MKKLSVIIGIIFQSTVFANMAQPYWEGTLGSSPFINQFVQITHENLHITIDKDFQYAHFEVTYEIVSDKDGVKIPLLFYASDYATNFVVTVDGLPVKVTQASSDFLIPEGTIFDDFAYLFAAPNANHRSTTAMSRDQSSGFQIRLDDMLYFKTNITKEKHIIHVTYNASRWIDGTDWVNRYNFRYALSPAKFWKNFGSLDVTIDARKSNLPLQTNLGNPNQGSLATIAKWHFTEIPTNVILINYSPKIGALATLLTTLTPLGLALILGGFLMVIHTILVVRYRKNNPTKKWSLTVLLGSLIVPMIFVFTWISSYNFIDYIIGTEASKIHGYSSVIIIGFFPFITLLYLVVFWIIDKRIKKTRQTH